MPATTDDLTNEPGTRLNNRMLLAFVSLVMIGGSNAVAVRFSNLELPPFWGAASRFIATALIFWVAVFIRRLPLPGGRALLGSLLYGFLGIGAGYAFLYWGLVSIQASLTMIILALGPLLTLLLAIAHRLERFQWRGLVGALTAFIGITMAVGQELGSAVPIMPLLAVIAGAVCIAEASVVYKLFPQSDPLVTNVIATSAGAVLLLFVSLLAGEPWHWPTAPATWAVFAYLVLLGSVMLFYLYLYVLSRWTATATSYAFLLFPLATISLSAWLTDEVISIRFLVGGFVVMVGVWIGALRKTGGSRAAGESAEQAL